MSFVTIVQKQMSLGHGLAGARAARNVVQLGDPQQFEQREGSRGRL